MKNKLIIIFSFILIIFFFTNKIFIERLIEKKFSEILERKVNLELIKYNLFSGRIELREIKVENKKNFFNPKIFEAEKIIIKMNTQTYFKNLVIIKNVKIFEPKIFFEIKNIEQKNKKKIQDNLEIIKGQLSDKKPKIYPKKDKDKNFLINNLNIDDAVAFVNYDKNRKNLEIPLSSMIFKNIGNSGSEEIKFQHYKDTMKLIISDIYLRIPDKNLKNLIKKNYKIN